MLAHRLPISDLSDFYLENHLAPADYEYVRIPLWMIPSHIQTLYNLSMYTGIDVGREYIYPYIAYKYVPLCLFASVYITHWQTKKRYSLIALSAHSDLCLKKPQKLDWGV